MTRTEQLGVQRHFYVRASLEISPSLPTRPDHAYGLRTDRRARCGAVRHQRHPILCSVSGSRTVFLTGSPVPTQHNRLFCSDLIVSGWALRRGNRRGGHASPRHARSLSECECLRPPVAPQAATSGIQLYSMVPLVAMVTYGAMRRYALHRLKVLSKVQDSQQRAHRAAMVVPVERTPGSLQSDGAAAGGGAPESPGSVLSSPSRVRALRTTTPKLAGVSKQLAVGDDALNSSARLAVESPLAVSSRQPSIQEAPEGAPNPTADEAQPAALPAPTAAPLEPLPELSTEALLKEVATMPGIDPTLNAAADEAWFVRADIFGMPDMELPLPELRRAQRAYFHLQARAWLYWTKRAPYGTV